MVGWLILTVWLRAVYGLALLEKLSVWLKQPPSAREPAYAAAIGLLPSFFSGWLELLLQGLLLLILRWVQI